MLAGIVDYGFRVGLDNCIYELISESLSDIWSGPQQADDDDENGYEGTSETVEQEKSDWKQAGHTPNWGLFREHMRSARTHP